MDKKHCPLCGNSQYSHYHRDKRRQYWQCERCALVFVDWQYWLNPSQEKAEYDLHQNSPEDDAYRLFLNRLVAPLSCDLPSGARGLDFGSGPGPTLFLMFAERGFEVSNYDIFYADNRALLNQSYDFICATEVVEHLFDPQAVFKQLWDCLQPGGVLGMMTKMVVGKAEFSQWHYKNDMTHVCFYSKATFNFLAKKLGADVAFIDKDVIFLRKS